MLEGTKDFLNAFTVQYFDFSSRMSRKQYWMTMLWYLIFAFALGLLVGVFQYSIALMGAPDFAPYVQLGFLVLFSLGSIVPVHAMYFRRLHDIDKSGWWLLVTLVPFVGVVWFFALLCAKGDDWENSYGEPS